MPALWNLLKKMGPGLVTAASDDDPTLVPAGLRPSGKPNPMAVLHELASDGLHAKSDEECVDIFDACRRTFEYVFGKLRIETEDAKTFVTEMAALAEKKSKASSQMAAPAKPSAT